MIIVVLDNGCQGGSLRLSQDERQRRLFRNPAVDWSAFANAVGAKCVKIENRDCLYRGLNDAVSYPGPSILWVRTDPLEAYPYPEYVSMPFTSGRQGL